MAQAEIVRYDNFINRLRIRNFEQKDLDLFMGLCAKMRDKAENKQTFSYDYLMDLIDWDRKQPIERFHKILGRMNDKLLRSTTATIDIDENESVSFALFCTFRRKLSERTLTVSVNSEFKFLLNEITKNFTKFELEEYTHINGRYAKMLYQQIKQRYSLRGKYWQPTIEELRHVLDIPDKMENKRIMNKIIHPAVKEICRCKGLEQLRVEALKVPGSRREIGGYRFAWGTQIVEEQSELEEEKQEPQYIVVGYRQMSEEEMIKAHANLNLKEEELPF